MNYYQDGSDYIPGHNKPLLLRTINNGGWILSKRITDDTITPDKLDPLCRTATEACHYYCSVKKDCPLYNAAFPNRDWSTNSGPIRNSRIVVSDNSISNNPKIGVDKMITHVMKLENEIKELNDHIKLQNACINQLDNTID